MSIHRLEDARQRLLRQVSESEGISFGTLAPFRMGPVGFTRVGFGELPVVGLVMTVPPDRIQDLVPVVRQKIVRAVLAVGLPTYSLDLLVTVRNAGRRRLFVDSNASSPTCGKRKRGVEVSGWLEVLQEDAVAALRAKLPSVYL